MENVNHKPCLILNQDWKPLTVINWKRAICLGIIGDEIVGEGVRVVERYTDDSVKTSGGNFIQVPAVAVSNRFVKRRRKIKIKKKNLMIRDGAKCQYCKQELDNREATIDHVIPKSRFTSKKYSHHWENIVISCRRCNSKKGNRTPSEAGMKLLSVPKKPKIAQFYSKMLVSKSIPKEWELYVEKN
jgi:5-methylcytosine-specific restriction endonuclease McrA